MPNWKKVVVSGSKAHLNEVTASTMKATGAITAGGTITGNAFAGDGSSLTGVNNFAISNASESRFLTSNSGGTGATAISEMYIDGSFIQIGKSTYGKTSSGMTYHASSDDVTQGASIGVSSNDLYAGYIELKDNTDKTVKVRMTAGGNASFIKTGSFGLGLESPDTIMEIRGEEVDKLGQFHISATGTSGAKICLEGGNSYDSGFYFNNGNLNISYEMYYDKSAEHFVFGSGSKFTKIDREAGHITASGNISASGNVYGDEFYGDGSGLTGVTAGSITWANVSSKPTVVSGSGQIAIGSTTGTLAVNKGGTGATSLNDLITLGTHTTGNYIGRFTAGTGLTSTGATSGEDITHSVSVDASQTQITAVGTIGTGVWNGTAVDSDYTEAKVHSIVAGDGIDVSGATGDVTVTVETAAADNPGMVELATTAETTTGTDAGRAVTPDGLKDGYQGSANVTTLGTIATGTWNASDIALGTYTSGNYVGTVTAGTGLTSTGATSGEGVAHSLSVDASQTQITSVGTIGTGTWEGTTVALDQGGTGATTAAAAFVNIVRNAGAGVISSSAQLDNTAISTYSNASNNRILSSVDSTSVNSEVNLTFDGTQLYVKGDILATKNIVTRGDIIAQNYIVSSSTTYMTSSFSTGNTIFGDTPTDQHEFTGSIYISGSITPGQDATFNLGSASKRFANIYSADVHLNNESTDGNSVDGTNGNWTIQEGDENLYLLNNKNGKKYKFKLEEIE